jgi:hypothetical protein
MFPNNIARQITQVVDKKETHIIGFVDFDNRPLQALAQLLSQSGKRRDSRPVIDPFITGSCSTNKYLGLRIL